MHDPLLEALCIVGAKVARIMGNPLAKLKDKKQTEFFVEQIQAYCTLRPIGIFALKENTNSMKKIWSWLMSEAKKLSKIEIPFDKRSITIYWNKPFFGGDGKAYLALLALLAAYCYLCNLTEGQSQSTSRVMKGMPIIRTVKNLHAHYLKMKNLAEKSKNGH